MPVFNNALAGAAGSGGAAAYEIERSLRFNDDDSAHLSRTFSAGNSQKWTWAAWVKRNKLGGYQTLFGHVSGTHGQHYIDFGGDKIRFTRYVSSNEAALETQALYRDVSAWMHVCAIWDVGNSTANHRQRLFVNGVEVTEFSTRTNPSQNYSGGVISTAIEHHISKVLSQNYGAFQLADIHFLDGIVAGISTDDASGSVTGTPNAAYLTDFGKFDADTGVWNPIEYTGSYTTTGGTTGTLTNYNNNTSLPTYSDQDGNSGTPSVYQMENAFDGNSSTYANMTYANGKWTRANFAQPITNVTRIDIGWDGEGDVGYNGSVVNSSVGYTGSRQSLTLYNNAGSPITLNNIHMVTQAGNGVCRLYDITITTTTQSATELTFSSVPAGPNGFHLDFSDNSSVAALGYDAAGSNNWTPNNIILYETPTTYYVAASGGSNSNSGLTESSPLATVDGVYAKQTTGNLNIVLLDGVHNLNTLYGGQQGSQFSVFPSFRDGTVNVYAKNPGAATFEWDGPHGHSSASRVGFVTSYDSAVNQIIKFYGIKILGDTNGTNHTYPMYLVADDDKTAGGKSSFYFYNCVIGTQGSGRYVVGYNNATNYSYQALDARFEYCHFTMPIHFYSNAAANAMGHIGCTKGTGHATNAWNTVPSGYNNFSTVPDSSATNGAADTGGTYHWGSGSSTAYSGLNTQDFTNTDSLFDSPTNGDPSLDTGLGGELSGNYAAFNGLINTAATGGSGAILSDGNLKTTFTTASSTGNVPATIYVNSGKWYCEFTCISIGGPKEPQIGVVQLGHSVDGYIGKSGQTGAAWEPYRDRKYVNGLYASPVVGSTYTSGTETFGIALDMDNGTVDIYKDGSNLGQLASGLSGYYTFAAGDIGASDTPIILANYGQRSFKNAAPSGYKCLCTSNLDDPLIEDPSDHFDTTVYTGNGTSQSITGLNSPDFVWIKGKSVASGHALFDTVRGATKRLLSHSTSSELTNSEYLDSFTSDGFSVGNHSSVNTDTETYVGWAWDGGDLVTNSAYDQSEVWSSFWSATGNGIEASNPAANSFDGVLTGLGMRLNGSSSCTWAPTGGYSYSGNFLIYACKDNDYTGVSWTVVHAGGTTDITSSVAAGTTMTELNLTNLGVQSPITSISFTSNNNSNPRIAGMKANGKLLVDAGVIPVGSLNSSLYDQRQIWSNYITSSNGWGDGPDHTFDGVVNGSGGSYNNGGGGTLTYTHPVAETVTSLRLRLYSTSDVSLGGGTAQSIAGVAGTGGWTTVDVGSGFAFTGSNTMTITRSSGYVYIDGIEINGKELVDSNQTPSNVPTIASTVRANPTAGFSIATYTGTGSSGTVGHGLNAAAPEMILLKDRNASGKWKVLHVGAVSGSYAYYQNVLHLDTYEDFTGTGNPYPWGGTAPTSSVFSVGNISTESNRSGSISDRDYVAYCFASVEGYSAISSYTSTGGNNFIYTGFRPAFLICKKIVNSVDNTYEGWVMFDSERGSYNINQESLYANTSYLEGKRGQNGTIGSTFGVDFLSNGFAFKDNATEYNRADSSTYIYYAVAENPFKIARAR